MIRTKKKYP